MFHSLAHSAPIGQGPDAPTAYVASTAEHLSAFTDLLIATDQQVVGGADLSAYVVLAVFAGSKGSSGHEITVRRITVEAGQWRIVVSLQSPTGYAFPAFTSPYHVVQIPRGELREPIPSSWVLLDSEGRVLASGHAGRH